VESNTGVKGGATDRDASNRMMRMALRSVELLMEFVTGGQPG